MKEKTPEQLMEDFRLGKPIYIENTPNPPDYHTIALLAAQTLPNQSAAELLESADKIEAWLKQPETDARKFKEEFEKTLYKDFYKVERNGFTFTGRRIPEFDGTQKSPEITPEASDGVSCD